LFNFVELFLSFFVFYHAHTSGLVILTSLLV